MVPRMRWSLGLVAAATLVGAAAAWAGDDAGLAGILARVGIVLSAIWLAHPAVVRAHRRTAWLLGLGVVVVLLRPRSAIVVLPVIALFARTAKLGDDPADG